MQELVAVLKENARLVAEVQQLKKDLQSQVHTVGCQVWTLQYYTPLNVITAHYFCLDI